jgi:hypothetical protein
MVFLDRDSAAPRSLRKCSSQRAPSWVCFNLVLKRAEKTIEMVRKPNSAEPNLKVGENERLISDSLLSQMKMI